MEVVSQLEGAFALLIRSTRFPDELMAAKKGSPLLVGERPNHLPPHRSTDGRQGALRLYVFKSGLVIELRFSC